MLERTLKNAANYELINFNSAEEAIKNLYLKPDIIILDYYLEGMDGMKALKTLRQKNIDVPVIVLSSQKNIQTAIDVLEAGAKKYFTKKELKTKDLIQTIGKFFNERKIKERNFIWKLKLNKDLTLISLLLLGILGLIISII